MLLIGNGKLITRNSNGDFFEDGAVLINGETIVKVGQTSDLKGKYPDVKYLDADGGLIMPGLINIHNHIYSAFARGLNTNSPTPHNFRDILEGLWWKIDSALTLEDVKYSAYWTYIDCIKNGVTTVFDHHASYGAIEGSLEQIGNVAEKLNLRTCLCYEVSDRAGRAKMEEGVLENESYIKRVKNSKNQKGLMGLHAAFTLSNETLEFCAKHLPDNTGYHIHVAEGLDDVFDSLNNYGKRTVHRLHDMGILGKKTIACHCIHVNPQEMELLSLTDTMVSHNPESNMGNAVGCPPVLEFMKLGLLAGLGTDGYTNDMLESYKVANVLQKHNTCNPACAWTEIPQMLFYNNPKMVERLFETRTGVLEAGAAADVIIADYIPHTPLHAGNINSHILFGLNGRCVNTTIAGGKILMQDRKLIIADEEALMAKSRELARKLEERLAKI